MAQPVLFGEHRSPATDALVKELLKQRTTPIFYWRSQTPDAERKYARLVGTATATAKPLSWPTLVVPASRGQPQRIVQPAIAKKEEYMVLAKKTCPYSQRAARILSEMPGCDVEVKWASSAGDMDKLRRQYTDLTGKPFSTWPRVFVKESDAWCEIGGCDDLENRLNQ
ncbi:glutaredoxin [Acanthamoeba castellanii medusavirus]|uniref:Glutaredoxin n=1 Tax=Acanthamoeba castellanii medusavirus J1 TaxID=3114988 RepID=A0A3T1CWW0_9VIRU|nr:glutaredoxin [Acanthamoeba castellanii medusavirus]BBI30322.1 glutaredoxin [Acanthamoeba castellanii medusavirus J1]